MARCGARNKRGGICKRWASVGYARCRMHSGINGGQFVRHERWEDEARRLELATARFRLWAANRDKSQPYPCGRKKGQSMNAIQIAFLLRRWPHSMGWRRKAAAQGILPAAIAIPDPELSDRLALWSLPDRASAELIRAYENGELQ